MQSPFAPLCRAKAQDHQSAFMEHHAGNQLVLTAGTYFLSGQSYVVFCAFC